MHVSGALRFVMSGLKLKLGVQSVVAASHPAALEILAIPPVLLRFPPCRAGATSPFVLPQLQFQSTGAVK
jgi:hypothetical protein